MAARGRSPKDYGRSRSSTVCGCPRGRSSAPWRAACWTGPTRQPGGGRRPLWSRRWSGARKSWRPSANCRTWARTGRPTCSPLRDGRLLTTDEVAEYLRVRRSDVDQLARRGWLVEVTRVHSGWQRRREAPLVPLYRVGDLDALLADPTIDWEAVRSIPRGRPSPLGPASRPVGHG